MKRRLSLTVFPEYSKTWLFLTIVILNFAFFQMATAQLSGRQERNITAFCKLYGYVCYFHPSDEAQKIGWTRFLIYGCKELLPAKNDEELINGLKLLFYPIAPTVKIFKSNEKVPFDISSITPPNSNNYKLISWQHLGLGTYYSEIAKQNKFLNVRLNRDYSDMNTVKLDTVHYGQVYQYLLAKYPGKDFVLSCRMKIDSRHHAKGQIWLTNIVDTIHTKQGSYYDMSKGPVSDSIWKEYKISGRIDTDAKKILLGIYLSGAGTLLADDVNLMIKDSGRLISVPINNFSFEEGSSRNMGINSWQTLPYNNYQYQSIKSNTIAGKYVLRIKNINQDELNEQIDKPLFNQYIKAGGYIKKSLVLGISCIVPLALYGNKENTFPKVDRSLLSNLIYKSDSVTSKNATIDSLCARFCDVILAWNIYKHFFPYWEDASQPPDTVLHNTLNEAFKNKNSLDFLRTLKMMCASLNDGHMFTVLSGDTSNSMSAPVLFALVDHKIVIKHVLDNRLRLKVRPGVVVDSIGHQSALDALFSKERLVSGSKQWKEYKGLFLLADGPPHSFLTLSVTKKGRHQIVKVLRDRKGIEYISGSFTPFPIRNGEIEPGIFYFNLTDSSGNSVRYQLNKLASAKAIIFDLRGYPYKDSIMEYVIEHLLTQPDTAKWIHTPEIIYPDYKNVKYRNTTWGLQPKKPHFKAKVFFLADASCMSACESYLSYVKYFKLGTIVGRRTAGTNGDINVFRLPGNYQLSFSGNLITNHDGSKFHLNGITPDVLVNPTIKEISNSKDAVLDTAILLGKKLH